MNSFPRSTARAGVLTLALAIAACSHAPTAGPQLAHAPQATPASEIDAILSLLDQGDSAAANKRIDAALKRDPANAPLHVLRDSIDRDPKELLGPTSFAYTAREGDTMFGLAQRFLGNRLKAYQLARYNGIARPAALTTGQALRIPGEPPRVDAPKRAEPKATQADPAPGKGKSAASKPPASKPPAANPAAARQARAAGLAALNSGSVTRAVGLLRRAASLDPANPVIARDLARAQRIAATVKART